MSETTASPSDQPPQRPHPPAAEDTPTAAHEPVVERNGHAPLDGQYPSAPESGAPQPGYYEPPPPGYYEQPPANGAHYEQPGAYGQQQPPPGYYEQQGYTPPPGYPPAGYPQPGYGAQPPAVTNGAVPAPPPEGPSRRPLILSAVGLVVLLVLGAAAAVILTVSGADKQATALPAATAAAATKTQPQTVTVVQQRPAAKHKKKRTTTRSRPPAISNTPATPPASSSFADKTEIKSLFSRHFSNIENGNYSSAYNDLTGQAKAASQSSWISEIKKDGLYNFSVSVSPTITSPTSAVADIINFHTEASDSGCKDWYGSWNVTKIGGSWYISKSNLSQTVVSCGE